MKTLRQFIDAAINGNISGVQNDSVNVWVEVEGEQYELNIEDVLGRKEIFPFEVSYLLEKDYDNEAWEALYNQYVEDHRDV